MLLAGNGSEWRIYGGGRLCYCSSAQQLAGHRNGAKWRIHLSQTVVPRLHGLLGSKSTVVKGDWPPGTDPDSPEGGGLPHLTILAEISSSPAQLS
jgi:hypothetical protein